MSTVPQSSIGRIEAKEVGYWKSYQRDEKFSVYEFEKYELGIVAKYIYDFATSIWFANEEEFKKFPSKYRVSSGGWYGSEKGGRWRTEKRTFGTVTFEGVTDLVEGNKTDKMLFAIHKPRLTNRFNVNIQNSKISSLDFKCDNIVFKPSNKIYLIDNEINKYVDMTDKLTDDNMRFRE